ncbi:MAG: DUF1538 domain-containing protein [Lachnospiraceae bacterium]|nr:DUF1538 domain-containing protein [Lachnospiraceae bacterium]
MISELLRKKFKDKFIESLSAVWPMLAIVLVLSCTIAPIPSGTMLCFLFGTVFLIVGMMFFTLGAETAMSPLGEKVGSTITKRRSLPILVGVAFLIGFIITVAEPDLQVLANQVPAVPNMTLIFFVAGGVGIFLVIALLRILFGIALNRLFIIFYAAVFLLSIFVPKDFLAVAFDAGGVTTGPMTVPFIIALGVGVSAIRSDQHAGNDSFGLVALCSVGPIIAVMILGILYGAGSGTYTAPVVPDVSDSTALALLFGVGLPEYAREIVFSLFPILVFFIIFQIFSFKLPHNDAVRILYGLLYTYIGLVIFLTGVNVGFLPAGYYLGQILAGSGHPWIIVPIAMVMGYYVVKAEPAVYVLNKQVEEITDGGISAQMMGQSLSVGVALSLGLAMVRVLTGISIMWFLVPGYVIAIGISFFVPKIYTAIAFDSGGVASGPMTAAFLLPFAQGACLAVGGDIVRDAFGIVAMVAMTPLITIQVLGLVSQILGKRKPKQTPEEAFDVSQLDDTAIIEL